MIRVAREADAGSLAVLYNHYVVHTVTTFEEEPVAAGEMADRIARVQRQGLPWIVLEEAGELSGYAYAVPWKGRAAYRHSAEVTIYLANDLVGEGRGTALYSRLLELLSASGHHCLLAGVALPNAASVALHEKLGFEKIAHMAEVGRKFDRWVDVGYWQRLLG